MQNIDFSVIIPHKDSTDSLSRLLNSIPLSRHIQVIVVDNSTNRIKLNQVQSTREFQLLYSAPERYAGGARNLGLESAKGKWIIFADADDFFTKDAFDIFYSHINDDYDLIYYKTESVYDDTLAPSDRNIMFNQYIDNYLGGVISEMEIRVSYVVPWGKMIRRSLIIENNIRFEEVLAANDIMFSTRIGYYSKSFAVDANNVYVVTTRKGSLANRLDLPVIESRYQAMLRRNAFLKQVRLNSFQSSVMVYIYKALTFGIIPFCSFIWLAMRYRQNIFIGIKRWHKTARSLSNNLKKNKKYFVK